MKNSAFLHFLTLLLFKQKSKHLGAILISMIIIFLLSSVLFISSSLQQSLLGTLDEQPDFTVSRVEAGRAVNTPVEWIDRITEINGVSKVTGRIYGRYYFAPREKSFLIVGVDFFDEQNSRTLKELVDGIDLKVFLSTPNMLVGEGVRKYLNAHYYKESFSFKTPQGSFKKVNIYKNLPEQT